MTESRITRFSAIAGIVSSIASVVLIGNEVANNAVGRKFLLKREMEKVNTFKLNPILHYVKNAAVEKALSKAYDDSFGGIQVLYAPPGSGKTSYLIYSSGRARKREWSLGFVYSQIYHDKRFLFSVEDERRRTGV